VYGAALWHCPPCAWHQSVWTVSSFAGLSLAAAVAVAPSLGSRQASGFPLRLILGEAASKDT
jgi:hypothetical protein